MCKACSGMDSALVTAWFRTWFRNPVKFWKQWLLVNSPEADFVAQAILAMGDD